MLVALLMVLVSGNDVRAGTPAALDDASNAKSTSTDQKTVPNENQPAVTQSHIPPNPISAWQYLVSDPTKSFPTPPAIAIPLGTERPALLLQEPPKPAGVTRQYGLIRYGSAQSIQIALILDDRGAGQFDLYVNADRDAELTSKELVPGSGATRQVKLSCEMIYSSLEDQGLSDPTSKVGERSNPPLKKVGDREITRHVERIVTFKRGITGKSLTLATQGFLKGQVKLQDVEISTRRVDSDGNGLFSDARDRVWLDLNRDGQWDSFQEQFTLQPLLTLNGKRYAVKTDAASEGLRCEPILGEGLLRFAMSRLHPGAYLTEIEITVVGRDGSAFAARAADEAITLPIGDYALSMVRVVIAMKENDGPHWEFVFSTLNLSDQSVWHTVKRDQTTQIDPVGKMNLNFEWDDQKKPVPAGRQIHVRPILTTQDGLVINSGKQGYGSSSHELQLTLNLCHLDGSKIESARSGFS